MVQGYEQRGVIKDPNLNTQSAGSAPNDIPQVPVMRPQFSSMAAVGSGTRELASLLSKGSGLMQDYFDKQKDKWRVEGQLIFAQGKTQQELNTSGANEYTTEGYQAMQATTALQTWKQSKLIAMTQGDEKKTPDQYRQELQQGFSDVMGEVQSPYIKNLIAAHAERDLPELLSQQMLQNAKYKEVQTIKSAEAMVTSAANLAKADPKNQQVMLDAIAHVTSTMRPEQATSVLATAMELGLKSDNDLLTKTVVGTTKVAGTSGTSQSDIITFTIDEIEGASPVAQKDNDGAWVKYGINQRANPNVDVKNLTKEQAVEIYKKKYWDAAGIGDLPANMQALAFDTIVQHGVGGGKKLIEAAKGDPKRLLELRKAEYKRLQDSGKPAYKNMISIGENRLEKLGGAPAPVQNVEEQNDIVSTLLTKGFTAPQAESILLASKAKNARTVASFDKDRLANEDRIKNLAEDTGNLPAAYDEIQRTMKANGYTPEWGNSMVNDVRSGVAQYQKQAMLHMELGSALSNNSVGLLPKEKQKQALAIGRTEDQTLVQQAYVTGAYNEEAKSRNIPPEQLAQEKLQQLHLNRLVSNRVVDDVVAQGLQQDIRAAGGMQVKDIQDPTTGALTPKGQQVLNSIGMYYQLRSMKGSNPGFARKFLDEDSAKLMNEIIARDNTGQNLLGALTDATTSLNRPENMKIPPVDTKAVQTDVASWIDGNLTPGFFDFIFNEESKFAPSDMEIDAWKKDPVLNSMAASIATKYKIANPQISNGAAVQEAMSQMQSRGEAIAGSFLMSPEGTTIKEMAGLADVRDNLAVHNAVMMYMEKFGPDMWANYNEMQLVARPDLLSFNDNRGMIQTLGNLPRPSISKMGKSIADRNRGVPGASYKLNPQNGTIVVDLYRNKEETVLRNQPREIPLSEVGAYWKSIRSQPTTTDKVIKGAKEVIGNIIQ